MNDYHNMHLSNLDFGDNMKIIVCHQCDRSIAVEADENGVFIWKTMQVVNQGNFYAMHRFSTSEDVSISTSVRPPAG